MKYINSYLIMLTCLFCSCLTTKGLLSPNQFKLLQKKQMSLNQTFANSAKWSRELAMQKSLFNNFNSSDTVWIIERIDEVDKKVYSLAWDNKRETIIKYNNEQNFNYYFLDYKELADPLKTIVEEFSVKDIDNTKSYIGAYHVFISQITEREVKSHYFLDFTPLEYFKVDH